MIKFFSIFFSLSIFFHISYAEEIKVFELTEKELSELTVRKVRGAKNKTVYIIGSNENGNYIKAIADSSASGLGKEITINLNKTPFINITWKIEKDLPGIKEDSKKGHDFAARVFAVKKLVPHHYQIEQSITFFLAMKMSVEIGQVHIQKNQLIMYFRAV